MDNCSHPAVCAFIDTGIFESNQLRLYLIFFARHCMVSGEGRTPLGIGERQTSKKLGSGREERARSGWMPRGYRAVRPMLYSLYCMASRETMKVCAMSLTKWGLDLDWSATGSPYLMIMVLGMSSSAANWFACSS